eukprot:2091205-Rhodomonas_salina.1
MSILMSTISLCVSKTTVRQLTISLRESSSRICIPACRVGTNISVWSYQSEEQTSVDIGAIVGTMFAFLAFAAVIFIFKHAKRVAHPYGPMSLLAVSVTDVLYATTTRYKRLGPRSTQIVRKKWYLVCDFGLQAARPRMTDAPHSTVQAVGDMLRPVLTYPYPGS